MLFDVSNHAVLNAMDRRVYGHDTAKKILINSVARSRLRYYQKCGLEKQKDELVELQKLFVEVEFYYEENQVPRLSYIPDDIEQEDDYDYFTCNYDE